MVGQRHPVCGGHIRGDVSAYFLHLTCSNGMSAFGRREWRFETLHAAKVKACIQEHLLDVDGATKSRSEMLRIRDGIGAPLKLRSPFLGQLTYRHRLSSYMVGENGRQHSLPSAQSARQTRVACIHVVMFLTANFNHGRLASRLRADRHGFLQADKNASLACTQDFVVSKKHLKGF